MQSLDKTREQLLEELEAMEQRICELEASQSRLLGTEKALRESEERFRLLYENAPLGYQSLDENGHFLEVNQAWLDTLGYSREEVVGKWFGDFLAPGYQDHFKINFPKFKAAGEIHWVEFEMLRKDGSQISVAFDGQIGRDERGQFRQTHCILHDISERKRAVEAMRESEARVRMKLDSILSPEGDIGTLELTDVIDVSSIQALMNDFFSLTKIPVGMIDLKGKVLVATGWQEICTKFHRLNPETCQHCIESDTMLSVGVEQGTFKLYRCKNNMWDISTPIIVGGEHLGNLFLGQFLFEDESPDYELFRSQARQYSFDEHQYLAALERVPRWSRETIDQVMTFYAKLAGMLSTLSYSNIKLARSLAEEQRLLSSLRDSEQRHRAVVDNLEVGISLLNSNMEIVEVNKALKRYFPHVRPACGQTCYEQYNDPPRSEPCSYCPCVLTLQDGKVHEAITETPAGSEIRYYHLVSSPIKDSDGRVQYVIELTEDITERKKAEDELRESEERFRMIYESGVLGMGFCDLDGRVLDANDTYLAMIRRSREDLLNNRINWREITPAEHLPADLNGWDELMATGRCTPYEKEYLLPNGTRVPVVIGGVLLSGSSSTAIAFALDITERKRVEEALRASEEKYRLLVDKAQEGIFVVQDTVFRFVNPRLEEIAGFSADELIGTSFGGFVHPDDRETVIEKHYRRLKGEVFPSRYEIRIIDKQNRVKWVEIDSVVIDWEGKPAAMVFLTDTSYRKLAEEAAVQTERLKAIADLSGGVAHHFNNLLQIVMAGASLSLADLESGDLTGIKTTLEQILEGASRGSEMVKSLQTFASTRANITEEEAAIFDIAATARNAAEISKPLWKAEPEKKGIKVNLLLDLEEGCLVQGKENEMFEVLVSLISNAAEALPAGGDIEVKAGKEADDVVVRIRDTGTGIAEDDLPRVFQPFWSTRGVGIGKGMGLAVTHGLVKRHGGTISLQSKAGEGATFAVRLPLAPAPVTKTEQPPISTAKASLTILIIEDELHIATLLERILEKAGHGVFKTLSGEEGLAVAHKEQVDLVICDLGMPGMNGWDVGKAIRSICREKGITKPPFVLLTGWGGQELETEKIAESGTDAVVAKPIDSAALLATVQEIAERFNVKSLEK